MILDAHNHIFPKPLASISGKMTSLTAEDLIHRMDTFGIEKAIIFSAGIKVSHELNMYIMESAAKFEGRLYAFVKIDPYDPSDGLADLKLGAEKYGVRGVKLHPGHQAFRMDAKFVEPIIEKATMYGAAVLFHTGEPAYYAHPWQVMRWAESYPKAKLILGHMGESWYGADAVHVAERCKNVILETSTSNAPSIALAVDVIGAERVIYGSDSPWGSQPAEIAKIKDLPISDSDKAMILGESAWRMLQI